VHDPGQSTRSSAKSALNGWRKLCSLLARIAQKDEMRWVMQALARRRAAKLKMVGENLDGETKYKGVA